MLWSNFLHIYQPAKQQPDILESVVKSSYEPLLIGLKKHPSAKITLNINGSLVELFDKHGHQNLIDLMRDLGRAGQIEFTGSAKYHAFLPFLNDREITRQVTINNETNSYFLGDAYAPKGFFPPEMGYEPRIAPIIEDLGFDWIILDEIAAYGKVDTVDYTKCAFIKGTNLKVFFRERRLSNLIMSAVVRNAKKLKKSMQENRNKRYIVTAMDGETFGHHRPGLENLLFEIFADPSFNLITISEIANHCHKTYEVEPIESTWASSEKDLARNVQFLSWRDPENPIHTWQWELTNLALQEVYNLESTAKNYSNIREKMDIALASDHFWWASAKPWWSIEMIENGAFRLLEILRSTPNTNKEKITRASELYEKIISTAFEWQRAGKIRALANERDKSLKIPFKERTLEKGGSEEGVYHAFLDMMKELEKKSSKKGEYEEAILWRDARYKLEHKLDIYDSLNAINLLRTKIPHEEIEKTLDKYTKKYQDIRGGQPEQRE